MNSTLAIRTRPYIDPHPTDSIKRDAIRDRDQHFATRKACIADMVRDNPQEPSEFYWTMVYDLEHAPTVTSRKRLLEHGIIPFPPQELPDPTSLHDELWTVIEALSLTGIYLLNTGHLTDGDLYARLYYRILDEETRLMPPSSEAAEYIDCLHPMDMHHPLGKMMTRREPDISPTPTGKPYVRGPKCTVPYTLNDRDDYLPRPSWQS
jgi:hypothetical protein